MEKLGLPKIGLRTLKTALAVFICMVLFEILDKDSAFFACIAAVICMKDSVESSVEVGKSRVLGTMLGGFIGLICATVVEYIPYLFNFKSVITTIGIVVVIYLCNLINKPSAVVISCIVISGIMCSYTGKDSFIYAIGRTFDTGIGVMVALLINRFIKPPK